MDLRSINEQKPKGDFFHVLKGTMLSGKLLKATMDGRMAHGIPLNALNLAGGPTVGHMHTKTNSWLHSFLQIMLIRRNRKGIHQGDHYPFVVCLLIFELSKTIVDLAQRALQLASLALVPIAYITTRIFSNHLFDQPLFKGLQQIRDNSLMNLWRRLFQALNQAIDRQIRLWYAKCQAKVYYDFAHTDSPLSLSVQTIRKGNPFLFATKFTTKSA